MTLVLRPRGEFSLQAAATFAVGFPGTIAGRGGEELRFTWAVDDDWHTAGVTLHQTARTVQGELDHAPGVTAQRAREDVERILCLDVDGSGFADVGRRDRVVAALQRRSPGLRPVLFYTPYEAATWTIIGHRIQMTQAARVRERLAAELGTRGAFPSPAELRRITGPQPGLTEQKVERLRAVADAALEGALGRTRLRALGADAALAELRALPGIGPFSAELVWVRGVGDPDRMPTHEKRLDGAIRAAYRLDEDADLTPISEAWRPYRAWVALLLRQWLADGAAPFHDRARPDPGGQ